MEHADIGSLKSEARRKNNIRVKPAEMLQALCVVRGGALPRGTAAPFTHPSQREARDSAGPQIREIRLDLIYAT